MRLCDLKPGERCRVVGWIEHLPDRLLEMGVLPGTQIEVVRFAPLGDPMALRVQCCQLAIRREDAARIEVEAA